MDKKRIVVKVGTSTLCHGGRGLNFRNIDRLARVLSDIKNEGHEVVLVTSGAIGAGCAKLNLPKRPDELRMKQAVAAVGQCELMHIYDKFFGDYGSTVGQILFTRDDVDRPSGRDNLVSTFNALLSLGVIPIVNENDSVCFEEIETEHRVFGDNDTLSAVVAECVSADLLILLSDIDGLFDSDPHKNPDARLIPVVEHVDDSLFEISGGAGSSLGTGGMYTKMVAAKIATQAGIDMVIFNGADPQGIYIAAHGGQVGTLFRREKHD